MKPRSYTSEGIVLAKKNFGEADKIIVIYSKDRGKTSLIAKGIRRPKSRKRGHIEVFNKIQYQAVIGRGLDLLTEAQVLTDFKIAKSDLKRISLAYYFMEVTGKITHDGEVSHALYNLIYDSLSKLKKTNELKKLRLNFVTRLLIILGYWPDGKALSDPDEKLEEIIERQLSSARVGKILTSPVK